VLWLILVCTKLAFNQLQHGIQLNAVMDQCYLVLVLGRSSQFPVFFAAAATRQLRKQACFQGGRLPEKINRGIPSDPSQEEAGTAAVTRMNECSTDQRCRLRTKCEEGKVEEEASGRGRHRDS
jgi:hypothetical protein